MLSYNLFSTATVQLLINKKIKISNIKHYTIDDYLLMLHETAVTNYNTKLITSNAKGK